MPKLIKFGFATVETNSCHVAVSLSVSDSSVPDMYIYVNVIVRRVVLVILSASLYLQLCIPACLGDAKKLVTRRQQRFICTAIIGKS